jgi:hypothetical protein
MFAKLRPRSAYDVMAALALFIAISTGGAYAANTVFSTDIVDGEVKTPDIANLAVTGAHLKAQAVTTQKVKDNNLTATDIAADAVGAGELNTVLTFGHLVQIGPGSVGEAVATCFPGWIRLSGGAEFDFPSGEISASRPGSGESWVAEGSNNGGLSQSLTAWVTCLKP